MESNGESSNPSEQLDKLKQQRQKIKNTLERSKQFVMTNKDGISSHEADARLQTLQPLLQRFEAIQDELEDVVELGNLQNEINIRIAFENDYFKLRGAYQEIIAEDVKPKFETSNNLPKINLPKFDGTVSQWLTFSDTFISLVHQDKGLDAVKKFHYLKNSLSEQALNLISSIPLTAANYQVAWETLEKRYNNQNLIANFHLNQMFTAKSVQKENYFELQALIDCFEKNLKALQVMGIDTKNWDCLLIFLLCSKLDAETKRMWDMKLTGNQLPSYKALREFLDSHCYTLQSLSLTKEEAENVKSKKITMFSTQNEKNCPLCLDNHKIYYCEKLLKLSIKERFKAVKEKGLCIKCLQKGHIASSCRLSNCKKCEKPHNTLLHFDENNQTNTVKANFSMSNQVLLATSLFAISSGEKQLLARGFFDGGSQSNFITDELAKKLKLKFHKVSTNVQLIGNSKTKTKFAVECVLSSPVSKFSKTITCLVVPNISDSLPTTSINTSKWKFLKDFDLADPNFSTPSRVDLLIGADTVEDVYLNESYKAGEEFPSLRKTLFGWVIMGKVPDQFENRNKFITCCSMFEVSKILQKFWEIEEVDAETKSEDAICEQHFQKNHKRLRDGRFEVQMPFIELNSEKDLGDSLTIAECRFRQLERRFQKNKALKKEYSEFMSEYLSLKHMEIAPEICESPKYYLPHHAVFKEDSSTTKLRVVFNGSQKSSNGVSLNDLLLTGPTVQDELFNILCRFRCHRFVFSADIAKMYRQISLAENQRDLLRILWRSDTSKEIQHFRLTTVTYGTKPAAFLATRCLKQLSLEFKNTFPLTANILQTDCYVDNILSGADDINTCLLIQKQLIEISNSGCFPLRKWCSNSKELIQHLSSDLLESKIDFRNPEVGTISTLGLSWQPKDDLFVFKFTFSDSLPTKRLVISETASIFDPLGLLSPIIVRAKILIQLTWLQQVEWDASLDQELSQKWLNFREELNSKISITIPRHIGCTSESYTLHIFCDASKAAYAACVYICVDVDNKSRLLCSKTRVSPLKSVTIARLELCGALLAAKLCKKILDSFCRVKIDHCYFWCDSKIVLCWLKSPAHNWKVFVANRVNQIHDSLKNISHSWHYVSTHDNPADLASRGSTIEKLQETSLWWEGPEWLKNKAKWALWQDKNYETVEEAKTSTFFQSTKLQDDSFTEFELIEKYSSLSKAIIVIVFIFRFYKKLKKGHTEPYLTAFETKHALTVLVRLHQAKNFKNDINSLKSNRKLEKNSKLISLVPFIDEEGILRVGGRLSNCSLKFEEKHPIILSSHDHFTELVISSEHKKRHHAGSLLLRSIIGKSFWIIKSVSTIKKVLRKCLVCAKLRKEKISQLMGNLPTNRVSVSHPFTKCGLDFAGPFSIKKWKGRCNSFDKCYICLFVCFVTRAIHIELVSDLSTEAFIASLRRFIGRRGKPTDIYCDNGRNFVGAKSYLDNFRKFLSAKTTVRDINQFTASEFINWHMIPAYSPHMGGLWEAGIKSTKTHLKTIIEGKTLTFEELNTVLIEIEASLNSRPLTELSNDPSDLECLTPSHFLINRIPNALPLPSVEKKASYISGWKDLNYIAQQFWQRWQSEYLRRLQNRTKWSVANKNLQVGELVMISDIASSPLKWPLGRIKKLYPGKDNLVRVVDVETTNGIVRRAVPKLCRLPIHFEPNAQ